MTREEQINTLTSIIQECEEYQQQRKETLYEIIKVLEQKPCEDAISREEALKAVDKRVEQLSRDKAFIKKRGDIDVYGVKQYLLALPSVYPKQKTGRWIHDGSQWKNRVICSECGYKVALGKTNFCPNCGAKMIENEGI